jgi:predicted nucleic acid-binding protein
MRTALDSSVLILLYRKEAGWEAWRDRLQQAGGEGELILSPVAFAEFSIGYPNVESARADLERLHIFYAPIEPESAYLAGQIFLRYRREGGPRRHLIPDFLIAAHASMQADRLAAIDRGYLRAYFPALRLLTP